MTGNRKDDEGLWEKVKQTVNPLKSNRADQMLDIIADMEKKAPVERFPNKTRLKPLGQTIRPYNPEQPTAINLAPKIPNLDEPTRRKISKGRLQIDATIDLHGMTQLEAYTRLALFLERAHEINNRTVLVITGKGQRGEGILRQAVPRWLNEPSLRRIVSGFHEASISHGGSGALYVRVRRKKVA